MKTFWQLLPSFLLVALASVAQAADGPADADRQSSSPDIKLLQDTSGDLVLAISRPWKTYSRPSIEVCLLPDAFPETARIRPEYFVSRFLKGQVTVDLYRSLEKADELAVRRPFSAGGEQREIVGNRNSLGKAAVCVACRTESPVAVPPEEKTMLSRATFCLLEYWAGEKDNLYLDLPPDYFGAPGRLQIWILRDDKIVSSDTIRWPGVAGYKPAPSSPAASDKPAAPAAKAAKPAQPRKKAQAKEE